MLDVLEELDWCLYSFENVSANTSMGKLAGDKFKQKLHRELSHLSETGGGGARVAEWVTDITNIGECTVLYCKGELFHLSRSGGVGHWLISPALYIVLYCKAGGVV